MNNPRIVIPFEIIKNIGGFVKTTNEERKKHNKIILEKAKKEGDTGINIKEVE